MSFVLKDLQILYKHWSTFPSLVCKAYFTTSAVSATVLGVLLLLSYHEDCKSWVVCIGWVSHFLCIPYIYIFEHMIGTYKASQFHQSNTEGQRCGPSVHQGSQLFAVLKSICSSIQIESPAIIRLSSQRLRKHNNTECNSPETQQIRIDVVSWSWGNDVDVCCFWLSYWAYQRNILPLAEILAQHQSFQTMLDWIQSFKYSVFIICIYA